MTLWSRLRAFLSGPPAFTPLASRRARREAARRRHHETGEPPWTPEDQHLGPAGEIWVADVTPGLPGHAGSVRTIKDD
jgi:hypothetical protein